MYVFIPLFLVVGFGWPNARDDFIQTNKVSFEKCIETCYKKKLESSEWNGMNYYWIYQQCYCHKKDQGHVGNNKCLHYRFK